MIPRRWGGGCRVENVGGFEARRCAARSLDGELVVVSDVGYGDMLRWGQDTVVIGVLVDLERGIVRVETSSSALRYQGNSLRVRKTEYAVAEAKAEQGGTSGVG